MKVTKIHRRLATEVQDSTQLSQCLDLLNTASVIKIDTVLNADPSEMLCDSGDPAGLDGFLRAVLQHKAYSILHSVPWLVADSRSLACLPPPYTNACLSRPTLASVPQRNQTGI